MSIVVDTNIIAYLYLQNQYTSLAENLLLKYPDWHAPILWKSELRNVLAKYLRSTILNFDEVLNIQTDAENLMENKEYQMDSYSVLKLVKESDCSAYACEFIAFAKSLNTKLVTLDKKILAEFKDVAVSLEEFV